MIGRSAFQSQLIVALAAWGALSILSVDVRGQSSDPTQMSPEIAELLNSLSSSQQKKATAAGELSEPDEDLEERIAEPQFIRLRGMVLRDGEREIAFLIAGEQRITLPLDRKQLSNTKFSIGSDQFELADFSPHALQIRNLTNLQTLHVN